MTTPATREDVVELMFQAAYDGESTWMADAVRNVILRQLTALDQAGIALVPVEATEEMLTAGSEPDGRGTAWWVWVDMIAASPYVKPAD